MFSLFKNNLTPEQLLLQKYEELAESNGFIGKKEENYGPTKYVGNIAGTDIQISGFVTFEDSYDENFHRNRVWQRKNLQIGIIKNDNLARPIFEMFEKWVDNEESRLQREAKEKQEREIEEAKEKARIEQDKIYMDEFNRISGIKAEFNPHFKILTKIESLGKKQTKILEEWQKNNDEILNLRNQFYSLG